MSRPARGNRQLILTSALTAMPIGAATVMVWLRRWISDDGFINIRVIHQLMAGRGPIYNVHERVEVGTSTLWLMAVWLFQAVTPTTETGEEMVVLGTALTALALILLAVGSWALSDGRGVMVPLGLLVVAALPVVWDFGTSGLETSLSMAWIAACFAALAFRLRALTPGVRVPAWRPWPVACLIGLGPLVRPDFALLSLAFGIALLWQSARSLSGWLAAAGVALTIPVAYEVFRMGFFASLVPNTALAKANGSVAQGWTYVQDFLGTYWLGFPLAFGALAILLRIWRSGAGPNARSLFIVLPVAGLAHAGFVVSVGGDFMHGRFLLPATLLCFAPIALVSFAGMERLLVVGTAVWALICGLVLRPVLWNGMIADERTYYSTFVADVPGASIPLENWSADVGFQLARRAAADHAAGASYYVQIEHPGEHLPRPEPGVVVVLNSLGVAGAAAGLDVIVNDPPSLGDPIGARLVLPPDATFRVGHAYKPEVWAVARYASGDRSVPLAGLAEARRTLACAPVAELLEAVSAPLTVEVFLRNLLRAPRLTFLRIPSDPVLALQSIC